MATTQDRPARMRMNSCGASRLLLVGFLIGTVVSSMTGSDLIGWAAAALGVGLFIVVRRIRGTEGSCAMTSPEEKRQQSA